MSLDTLSGERASAYTISAGPVFKFETISEYIYVDKWFTETGQSLDKFLEMPSTKRVIDRILPLIKEHVVKQFEIKSDRDDDVLISRIAVNKNFIPVILKYLNNDKLHQIVNDNMEVSILIAGLGESLHIRTSDGWISVTKAAAYFSFDVEKFIKCEPINNLIGTFGEIISVEPIKSSNGDVNVWMHPVGLLPLMLWIDSVASLELMSSFFLSNSNLMPNLDSLKLIIEKNTKVRETNKKMASTEAENAGKK
jgi:hypothetical protein